MRRVNCIFCGLSNTRIVQEQTFNDSYLQLINPGYDKNEPRRWVSCTKCSFIYHDPQLDDDDVRLLYERFRDVSIRNESPDEYFDRITTLPNDESENHEKVTWLREHLPREIRPDGLLLDIGCGGGVFIHTFKTLFPGWRASGVEPTTSFAKLASRRLSEEVIIGNYNSSLFTDKKFDLISINQVLEHIVDPHLFLLDVKRDLAEGGFIYIEVPDVSDFETLLPEHDRFQMQHLWYFSTTSLSKLCKLVGYNVLAIEKQRTYRGRNNLRVLLQSERIQSRE
jgi:2-polyprenyl-3-methyl-5-hydroxy-6-metoxy-1,4-benzoquinol methylase